MLKLSVNELQLIAKSRGIKGYQSISAGRLLSALNASISVKENEADEILRKKTIMPDPTKVYKSLREIRK